MRKLVILVGVLTAIYACNSLNSKTADNQKDNIAIIPQATGPDASDLLKTLQGRWQSQQDPNYILEFQDTKMRHLHSGSLTAESDIEIDGSCVTSPCKMDSTDLTDGWCFMEKSAKDVHCYIIITCDKEYLKYNAVGVENGLLVFKKLL